MGTIIHLGVDITGLKILLLEGLAKPHVVERDGRPCKTLEEALEALDHSAAHGLTVLSNCPSSNPDGSCPGHET